MELLLDPSMWVGLLTLVVLEVVLGIDNLIFIAILAEKLPPAQRDRARLIGLGLALVMRLALLSALSWMFTLVQPLLTIAGMSFSGRDLILILGGFFLVFKGTTEMHDRVEAKTHTDSASVVHAGFWVIVTQIVVLDAVFSLDAVITAVGMVDDLRVMMAAVIIAIGIMVIASKPLTRFVNARPTVIILCLGFLLMIGFALVAEGFGAKVPKGYLYAAIGFSVIIESLNQLARSNMRNRDARRPMRERTAEGILRMLGKRPLSEHEAADHHPLFPEDTPFGVEERNMVSGVLHLAERSVYSIMTPRTDISWLNLENDDQTLIAEISQSPHGFFPVCQGTLDNIVGIGRAKDMISDLLQHKVINVQNLRPPILVHETVRIMDLMQTLKSAKGQMVLVVDEFGAVDGVVTAIDLFEAIAGDFPDEDETPDIINNGEDRWVVDGATDLHHLEQSLEIEGLQHESDEYTTLAGYLLGQFGRLPHTGDQCTLNLPYATLQFKVLEIQARRIAKVLIERLPDTENPALTGTDGQH